MLKTEANYAKPPRTIKPLLTDTIGEEKSSSREVPLGTPDDLVPRWFSANPEFFFQARKFMLCFAGLQASYLTWGYMQELIMTTQFTPT